MNCSPPDGQRRGLGRGGTSRPKGRGRADKHRPARNHSPAPAGLLNNHGLERMSELATLAEQSGTKFILALFVDLRGKPCAKLVPVEAVDLLATDGVGFAGYAVGA